MLLTIDIGNTNIVLGLYKEKDLIFKGRINTKLISKEEDLKEKIEEIFPKKIKVKDVIICSVVPPLKGIVINCIKDIFSLNPIYLKVSCLKGVKIKYPSPLEVGIDRIVNCIAVKELYSLPAIVVDLGTATTFEVISEDGSYLGGAIAPGVEISSLALFEKASMLPKIKLKRSSKIMGVDTVSSMENGIYFGFKYLIEGIIEKIKEELNIKPIVIMTGGLNELYREEISKVNYVNPSLTIEGLRIIYEKKLYTKC
jgi:type III pantothenate kinase